MENKIYLSSPHMCGAEIKFVQEAFESNWIAPLGPNVNCFEQEVAAYVGAKSAAALSSGTAAIHMALRACGVGAGDTVFCSALTFSASCNPIIYEKAEPVFIDSEPESYNMSSAALKRAFLDYRPKAVIVVNLYGQSADFDRILPLCAQYGVPVIEDSAESLGATYREKKSGTLGKFGVYSFNGNKIITTSGGGMLVSDDTAAIEKVRFWATQSRDRARHYQHSELGFNYRMSNVAAGIGRGQLTVITQRIAQKKAIYEYYKNALASIDAIEMSPKCEYGEPNCWLSFLTLREDSPIGPIDMEMALEENNIECRPVWKPMQLQPFYKNFRFYPHGEDGWSVSEDIFRRGVCLPSDTKMTWRDLERVTGIIKSLF